MVYVLCLTLDHVLSSPCDLSSQPTDAGGRQSAGEAVKRIRGGDMARIQARWLVSRFAQLALALFLCSLPSCRPWTPGQHGS
jgi:hypothetical protein